MKQNLIVTEPQRWRSPQERDARGLADRLGDLAAGVFAEAAMHTPTDVTGAAWRGRETLVPIA